jgi:hypothetical protein
MSFFTPFAFVKTIEGEGPAPVPIPSIFSIDFSNTSCYPGSGSIVTDLATGFQGAITGSPTFNSTTGSLYFNEGVSDELLTFSGSGTRYEIPPSGSATWVVWCSKQSNLDQVLIGKGPSSGSTNNYPGNYELLSGFNSNNAGFVTEIGDNTSLAYSLPTGSYFFGNANNDWTQWTITSTYNSGSNTYTMTHYKNGAIWQQEGLGIAGGFAPAPNQPLRIAAKADGTQDWKGRVAVIQIYDLLLSPSQITEYYDSTKTRFGL